MKTKAAVLTQIDHPLEIQNLTIPQLKPGQVLVKVAYSGICHTQLNEIRGKKGPDNYLPHTLGHEGSGVVFEVGPDVTKVKKGDHVVLTWIKAEGADVPSTQYMNDDQVVNSGAISTFMEYTVTCENRLVVVPDKMPLKEAALLGCAMPTGAGIILNNAKVEEGSTVAVFGSGGIGLCAILGAKMAKASMIIAIDVQDHKLEMAKQLGATHVIQAKNQNAVEAVMELTNGKGVDYAVEAAGLILTMEQSYAVVKNGGGLCILAGNLAAGQKIQLDPFDLIKGKQIIGTWGGGSKPDKDITFYAERYLSDDLPFNKLITDTYPLEEINTAIERFEQGQGLRTLLEMAN
jgi:S-(hydroxymethyl)glutathione dehydrogenase / alcohol dehydrogenase